MLELKKLAKVFALSANRTPRSLVRRVNTTLVDIALRDPEMLPNSLKEERSPYPNFSGLCIVHRTLEAAIGAELTRELADDSRLCEVIAKHNIWGIDIAIKAAREDVGGYRGIGTAQGVPIPGEISNEQRLAVGPGTPERDPVAVLGWKALFSAIFDWKFLWFEEGWIEDVYKRQVLGEAELDRKSVV